MFGLILISLSVWRNIDLSIDEKGITAKFEQFAAEVKAETGAAIEKIEKTESVALEVAKSVTNLKRSIDVRNAQAVLSAAGYAVFADGFMGPQTNAALKRFQEEKGIPVTGELDRETMAAMKLFPMN
ncbi:peptidoglycan-binding domain-containing protein [Uliginosibacterium sediminicola]|uniref:Peptidoglycan-binding domain-containing protein n=1 Tax=Uliginosibacterium sediminicola TaxID=2024550 RepID=A0ABU9Z3Z1_9RHOO